MILPGKHAVIVGQNGSGKSQMLIHLAIENTQPRVIFDTKLDDDFLYLAKGKQKLLVANGYKQFLSYIKKDFDYLIVRPAGFELPEAKALDNYLIRVAKEKNLSVFIDEVYHFHNSGRCYEGLHSLLTRGRSAGLSVIACTQRPAWISVFLFSEASYFIVYRLLPLKDRKKVAEFIPYNSELPPDFHFYYFSLTDKHEDCQLCEPIKIFKRPDKSKPGKLNLL